MIHHCVLYAIDCPLGGLGRSTGSTTSSSTLLPSPSSKPSGQPPNPSSIPSTALNPAGPCSSRASSGPSRRIVQKQLVSLLQLPPSSLPSPSLEQEGSYTMLSKSGQVPITSSSELIIVQADERTHIHKSVCVFLWPCDDGKRVFGEVAQGGESWKCHFLKKNTGFVCA